MASSSDDSDDEFVSIGTSLPQLLQGEALQKPVKVEDLVARDKQGRRRFHGAFTGGFSAGYFNSVGTKEGFAPSGFVSSRKRKNDEAHESRPEDFMDEEDFEEHGIAPRKFATVSNFTSEERKRKFQSELKQSMKNSLVDLGSSLAEIIAPDRVSIGIKLLQKMGWRQGQGLGPRIKKKKKKVDLKGVKIYGCARPPSDGEDSNSDDYVPESMSDITFAPKDICPINLEAKDNVHGLGYHGLDPTLALPGSHISLFDAPATKKRPGKGIQGQAFGVGAFEDEDEDIYAVEDMSNYNISMDNNSLTDSNFGWTAPRNHGKQTTPVGYVGKLLEGFCLSSKPLKPQKKFPPPSLPQHFKPQHWFRKQRIISHLPDDIVTPNVQSGLKSSGLTAVDRGLMLGEAPNMDSVFDLISTEDKNRIEATKEAIAMGQQLTKPEAVKTEINESRTSACDKNNQQEPSHNLFLSKFEPATTETANSTNIEATKTPLFQGSLNLKPFRKDPAKQARYDQYLVLVKQGVKDPYTSVSNNNLTEWERSREREEFAKTSKMFRPLSAMMSSRFVGGTMIDDSAEERPVADEAKTDQWKAADMKMFGKLTRDEVEWHPDKLLCRRFNVPNPYPGSDIVGLTTVKRDKYSVFNFLNFGADYQSSKTQEPSQESQTTDTPISKADESEETSSKSGFLKKKPTLASIFKVLDDPNFHKHNFSTEHKTPSSNVRVEEDLNNDSEKNEKEEAQSTSDMDLFRAIFKNSDSEISDDSDKDEAADSDSEKDVVKEDSVLKEEETVLSGSVLTSPSGSVNHSSKFEQQTPLSSDKTAESYSTGENSLSSNQQDLSIRARKSRWGKTGKSVFSVLNELEDEGKGSSAHNMGPESRSSPNLLEQTEDSEAFGPRLPQVFDYNQGSSDNKGLESRLSPNLQGQTETNKYSEAFGPRLPPIFDYNPVPSVSASIQPRGDGKQVDKCYDRKRHKHKKEKKKKLKHKKQKHKKQKKKSLKSSKHKTKSSDSDSDSDGSEVSDSELLTKLRMASRSGLI